MKYWWLFCVFLGAWQPCIAQYDYAWEKAKRDKKGHIVVHYYDNYPFVSTIANHKIEGIEYDLMLAFVKFVNETLQVELSCEFRRANTFQESYNRVKGSPRKNDFGICSFSITEQREREVLFSPPYMADYELLITSKNIPSFSDKNECNQALANIKGLFVEGSTFQENMTALRSVIPQLKTEISPSNQDIRKRVEEEDNLFAYVELPAYLLDMKKGTKITRQKFYKVGRKGYGVILPKQSDWIEPMQAFFASKNYPNIIQDILKKHFGNDVNETIQKIIRDSTNSDLGKEILLLNKEKELQSAELSKKEIQLKQQTFQRNVLFLGVLALGLLVSFVFYNYIAKQRSNRLLAEANKRWQDLNREKDQLLNIVAHDLRSPVNRIKGLMEIMKITNDWGEEQMQYCRMIDKAIQDSHQLIDDLLVIGRAEYEGESLPTAPLELQPYLQTLIEHFLPQATAKNIQLHLIAPQEPIVLPTDEDTLSRILGNLLSNAIKFSPTDKNVTLRLEGQARQVRLSIEDEGQGFTIEDKAKVFQKFQKLTARPTAGESSTGLGLSIAKILTEKLGGHISLESEWQKGSTFTLSFPTFAVSL